MRTTARSIVVLVLASVLLAACSDRSTDAAESPPVGTGTVHLRGVAFQPVHIEVEAGTTVEWVWDDGSIKHDVSAETFASELQASGTFTHTFDQAGEFPYVCTLHPNMKGVVTVS